MADEILSQFLIEVGVDAQGVGAQLGEIQQLAATAFEDLNGRLEALGRGNPFARVVSSAEQSRLSVQELTLALEAARTALATLGEAQARLGPLAQNPLGAELTVGGRSAEGIVAYRAELEQALRLQQELNAAEERQLEVQQRIAAAEAELVRARESGEGFLSGYANPSQTAKGIDATLARANLYRIQEDPEADPAAVARAESAALKRSVTEETGAAQVAARGQAERTLLSVREQLAGLTDREAKATLDLAIATARLTEADERGVTSQAQRLSLARQVEQAELRLTNVQAAQRAELEASAAGGGGGGFFGGLAHGLVGGGGFNPEGLGSQIGQAARYLYLYEALFRLQEGIKKAVDETKVYQEGLIQLDIALNSVGQASAHTSDLVNGLADSAARVGLSPGRGLEFGARGVLAFRDEAINPDVTQQIAQQSAQALAEAHVLAPSDKPEETQSQLISITREFELGFQGQTRVLDAATNANRNFGASIKDVLEGLSQVAGLANQSGFSVEQLANAISLISTSTGLSGSAAAGDLKRIIGGEGAPAFQKALQQVGIDTSQNFSTELTELGQKYGELNKAEQEHLITTLGGRRSAEALIPLLAQAGQLQVANALSIERAGAAQDEFNRKQDSLAGLLRQLAGAFHQLAVDAGQSGAGAAFGLLLEAALPVLRTIDEMIKVFDTLLPSALRQSLFAIIEFTAAVKLMQALAAKGAFASFANLIPGLGGRGAAVAAGEAAAAGTAAEATGFAAIGAAGAEGISGVAAGLGSLAAAAGPAALAIGGLVTVIGIQHAVDLHDALHKVDEAMSSLGNPGGSVDQLRNQAAQLAALEEDVKHKSSGFFGAFGALLSGQSGDSHTAERNLEEAKRALQDEAGRIGSEQGPGGGSGLGETGPVDNLNQEIKNLQQSGVGATEILRRLVLSVEDLTGAGNAAALATSRVAGGITTGGAGPTAFGANILAGLGGAIGSGVAGDRSLLEQLTFFRASQDPNLNPFRGTRGQGLSENLSDSTALRIAQNLLQVDPKTSNKITQQITDYLDTQGKTGNFSVLNGQDEKIIAQFIVNGLVPKDTPAKIREALIKLLVDAGLGAGGTPTAAQIKADPARLEALVLAADTEAKQRVSDANARGADPRELLSIAQSNIDQLTKIANLAKSAGVSSDALTQALAVARREAFDAFAKEVQELLHAAESTSSKQDKAALERQAARLLELANHLAPKDFPQGFKTLQEAYNGVTNASIAEAHSVQDAANAALQQAVADAAALTAEAARLEAEAQANLAAAAAAGNSDLERVGLHQLGNAAAARAQATAAAGAKPAPVVPVLNDPSYERQIQDLQNAANKSSGGGAHETAEQIAAAAAAANVFPGAKVEEAAVAIRKAHADLDAQKRGTVAFYNALAGLHRAQLDYSNAVLEAAHVARELRIDITNPVAVAQEDLRVAADKARRDRALHAPLDVLNADQLSIRQTQDRLEQTKFQQQLDSARTNYELGRITREQYISFLDKQRDNLQAITHRTFQQQKELDDVDKLLQEQAKQLSGQFNLGNISLPSIYQVRVQAQAGAGGNVPVINNNQISINGADLVQVRQFLTQLLGPPALSRLPTAAGKF